GKESKLMKKPVGNEKQKERTSPAHTTVRAIIADSAIPSHGRAERFWAMAAGVTIKPKMSSAPTAWTDSATVTASKTRNSAVSACVGTPRASATSGSTLRNSRGRATTRVTMQVAIPVIEATTT